MNPIQKAKEMLMALMLVGMTYLAASGFKKDVEAYYRGQLVGLDAIFILGAAIILGVVFYVISDQTLKLNNLQNTGLFPVAILLLSILPVLIAVLAIFRPQ